MTKLVNCFLAAVVFIQKVGVLPDGKVSFGFKPLKSSDTATMMVRIKSQIRFTTLSLFFKLPAGLTL